MFRKFILATAVAAMTGLTGIPASADVLTWRVRSTYPYKVYLEFYSKRYNRSWPGGGKAYVLRDSRFHTYRLNCRRGEKICYGAWTGGEGRFWGVGRYGEKGCRNCCYRCGGGNTRRITLTR